MFFFSVKRLRGSDPLRFDQGIGQAQVVAVRCHQDGRPRGEGDDQTLVAVDHHMVTGGKAGAGIIRMPAR